MDLALNNLQRLICHKPNNQPTNQPTFSEALFIVHTHKIYIYIYIYIDIWHYKIKIKHLKITFMA